MQVVASGHANCLPAETSSSRLPPVPAISLGWVAAVSRKRKQPSRRRKGTDPSSAARPSPGGEPALSLSGATFSGETNLVPVSCTFHDPETAVSTYEVRLPAGDGRARRRLPADLTLVKACQQQFAIERYPTMRLSRLGHFREDRSSLVWDMQEGFVSRAPRTEERHNDPSDLEEQRQIDAELAREHPLRRAIGGVSATSISLTQREQTSLVYGENSLIYCTAIEPRNPKEWSSLRASFEEEGYDHYSTIYDPHMFAQALASMAFRENGLLGNPITFRHPHNGHVAQCRNLPVMYGPVVYVRDRRAYIWESASDMEFVVRSIFAKTIEHQDQREYRLAILTAIPLEYATLDLTISSEMRETLDPLRNSQQSGSRSSSLKLAGCMPSPRILRCLSGWPSSPSSASLGDITLSSQLQGSFLVTGVREDNIAMTRLVSQVAEDVDYESIEREIAVEPRSASDARIAKFVLDGGPGNIIRTYDLGGINGTYRVANKCGRATLKASIPKPDDNEQIARLHCLTEFDGTFNLSNENQLIVSVTPMNPAATVTIDPPDAAPDLPGHRVRLSETEDTQITVTATSEDGSATSGFTISIDRDLYVVTTLAHSSD